ncbi:heavy metal translocating P-type ATPase [Lichenifustis flavocetrariae]|uniref:P-type Zn(2+) transporter n=1 Tax=Lichenifustis flavocetrariae TaxID=2949735 RepID=A0AA41Z490_9HYPH|nr:heavy metal translocating P-type ATPase [Lichenifustis flavocetrariae]MCW6512658.1 cadmium-translocating P-type ATPase [Lichenifustis flavocetrariae]
MNDPQANSPIPALALGSFTARLLVILIVAACAAAIWRLSVILVLLFGAVLLAIGLCAATRALSIQGRIPKGVSLAGVLLVGVGALGGAFWIFGSSVAAQFDDIAKVVPAGFKVALGWIDNQPYGHQVLDQLRAQIGGPLNGASLVGAASWATSLLTTGAGAVIRALGYGVVALFVAIYIAAQPGRYRHLCLRLVPPTRRPVAEQLINVSGRVLQRWLVGQMVVMLVIGVLSGIGLWLLGIEAAAALGLMGGLLCFIPFVGAILAAIPAFLVALTQGPAYAASVLLMYVGLHFVEGNFITPMVQAEATSFPPVLAILSTVAFGLLLGPVGVLLAAPLTLFAMAAIEVLYVQGALGEAPEGETLVASAQVAWKTASLTGKIAGAKVATSRVPETSWLNRAIRMVTRFLFVIPALGLASGAGLWWFDRTDLAQLAFACGTAPVLLTLLLTSVVSLARGEVGLDIVAALAMGGALIGGEDLAGVVVALMFAGGQALESYAQGSAEREMTALLGRVARTAQVRRDDRIETVPIETIRPGDTLLIRSGEALPVDGVVKGSAAVLDEAALTGEAVPVRHDIGSAVASGVTNGGTPFDLVASRSAADSTYAGVVNLVESARASKAPMSRLADRYAIGFLAVTVALAGGAWFFAGDWHRALAVLVVATPCPLILAVPVAVVSGMSWCARRGVLVKSAQTLETLARIKTLLMDKTGTLTTGKATLRDIVAADDVRDDDLVRIAGSLAQSSTHPMSVALVDAARGKGLELSVPSRVVEAAGDGLSGVVAGREVVLGQTGFVVGKTSPDMTDAPATTDGSSSVSVGIDGRFAGTLVFRDEVRDDAEATLRSFRDQGVKRIVLVTGDRKAVAEATCGALPIDLILSDMSPTGKVDAVRAEAAGGPALMVGDGINDAPALALADVGVALGARGAAAAAEAADVVVLVDRLDRIAEAIGIARRTRAIALQSVFAGIGLSGVGMIAAAAGYLPPLAGALTQEVIDVAVILNALRCLGEFKWPRMFAPAPQVAVLPAPMTRGA